MRSDSLRAKIIIRTNDSAAINGRHEIPYRARIVHGSLGFQMSNTTFFVGHPPFVPAKQLLTLSNRFPIPLTILDVGINDSRFDVQDVPKGTIVAAGASFVSAHLNQLDPSATDRRQIYGRFVRPSFFCRLGCHFERFDPPSAPCCLSWKIACLRKQSLSARPFLTT